MTNTENLMVCAQELARAFALLERANDFILPSTPQLISKQGLLIAARQAVDAAKDALSH